MKTSTWSALYSVLNSMDLPYGAIRWTEAEKENVGKLFHLGLRGIPDEVIHQVGANIPLTHKTRPAASVVRMACIRAMEQGRPNAADAFAEATKLVETVGVYGIIDPKNPSIRYKGAPQFSHPAVAYAIASIGGWVSFCQDEQQAGTLRAHFEKAFNQYEGSRAELKQIESQRQLLLESPKELQDVD